MGKAGAMSRKPKIFYGYVIVAVSFFIMFLVLGLQSTFGIFFKPIITDLGWTRAVTSGAFSLSMIVGGVFGIALGGLNDRFGPRLVLTLCGLLCGAGHLLMSRVDTIWEIYLFYGILIGTGSGVFAPVLSTVARWFTEKRSMMTGIVFMGTGVGILILPPLINYMINILEWRGTFTVLGIVILIGVIGSAQLLKRDPSKIGHPLERSSTGIKHSERKIEGLRPREAMKHRQFWMLFIALMSYGYCLFTLQVHIPPFVTDIGLSATTAALVLTIIGAATIIGEIVMGIAADRIGNRIAFLVGFSFFAIASLLLLGAREAWMFFLIACIFGFALGDCSTQESPSVAWLFGIKHHGALLGIVVFSFTIGAAIGPVVTGYIFDTTGSYAIGFILCAALAVLAFLMMLFIKPLVGRQ